MKFALEGQQRHYFRRHHLLEVEGLISAAQLEEFNQLLIKEKIKNEKHITAVSRLFFQQSSEIFLNGRDLSRINDFFKKFILNTKFTEIASDLISHRPLRFGLDQLYSSVPLSLKEDEQLNPYKKMIGRETHLEEITSIRGVLAGLMVCLKAPSSLESVPNEESIFAKKAGNAVFFDAEKPLHFDELLSEEESLYLLIVYTQQNAIYYYEAQDPQTHRMKQLGYVFGDRLTDKLNPILLR